MQLDGTAAIDLLGQHGIRPVEVQVIRSEEDFQSVISQLNLPVKLVRRYKNVNYSNSITSLFFSDRKKLLQKGKEILSRSTYDNEPDIALVETKIEEEFSFNIYIENSMGKYIMDVEKFSPVNIEQPKLDIPQKVTISINPLQGFRRYEALNILKQIKFPSEALRKGTDTLFRIFNIFNELDLVRIKATPLVLNSNFEILVANCYMDVDENSLYRQNNILNMIKKPDNSLELRGYRQGISYVDMDGEIAVLSGGAGSTMAILDTIKHYKRCPANFIDTMGGAGKETLTNLVDIVLSKAQQDRKVKLILVAMHLTATPVKPVIDILVESLKAKPTQLPVVAFFQATEISAQYFSIQEAKEKLNALGVELFSNLHDAIKYATDLVNKVK